MLRWCFIRRGRLRDTAEIGTIRGARALFLAGEGSFKGRFTFIKLDAWKTILYLGTLGLVCMFGAGEPTASHMFLRGMLNKVEWRLAYCASSIVSF